MRDHVVFEVQNMLFMQNGNKNTRLRNIGDVATDRKLTWYFVLLGDV